VLSVVVVRTEEVAFRVVSQRHLQRAGQAQGVYVIVVGMGFELPTAYGASIYCSFAYCSPAYLRAFLPALAQQCQ
jgi:hypothetical protein